MRVRGDGSGGGGDGVRHGKVREIFMGGYTAEQER